MSFRTSFTPGVSLNTFSASFRSLSVATVPCNTTTGWLLKDWTATSMFLAHGSDPDWLSVDFKLACNCPAGTEGGNMSTSTVV